MTTSAPSTVDQATGLLDRLCADVEQVRDTEFWKIGGDDLLAVGQHLERLSRLVWAAQVHLAGEVDMQGLAKQRSCTSTADLLRQSMLIHPGEAADRVNASRKLLPQPLPSGGEAETVLPELAAAVDAGDLDARQAKVIITAMNDLPKTVDAPTRRRCEQTLVDHGSRHDPIELNKIAQRVLDAIDPDGDLDPERNPSANAELTFGTRSRRTGLTPVSGKLDDLGVATVKAAIDALAAPQPPVDGVPDQRSAATRRAHALVQALELFLNSGSGPSHNGQRPQLTVTIDWDVLHGCASRGVLPEGATLTPAQTRQLMCDASIIPIVLGGSGEPLDVGRSSRTFPTGIARAIRHRDNGCSFPGCCRPVGWTDLHHIKWFQRDFGPTSLANGCCLCPFHHSVVHAGDWIVQMAADGRPEWLPPPWIDPDQVPRRNTVHQR